MAPVPGERSTRGRVRVLSPDFWSSPQQRRQRYRILLGDIDTSHSSPWRAFTTPDETATNHPPPPRRQRYIHYTTSLHIHIHIKPPPCFHTSIRLPLKPAQRWRPLGHHTSVSCNSHLHVRANPRRLSPNLRHKNASVPLPVYTPSSIPPTDTQPDLSC